MADIADGMAAGKASAERKNSKTGLLIGLVLMLLSAGGGFYAVYTGIVFPNDNAATDDPAKVVRPLPKVAFVPLDPLVINLGRGSANRHLKFKAELEVEPGTSDEVAALKPRVIDVLNGYLRAVAITDLEDPSALIRLRAQMLRRIQIVTGEGRVRDLLIMEFVLN